MKVFDDRYSIIHVFYGIIAYLIEPITFTLLFIAYEFVEYAETYEDKKGDIIEYVIGLILGYIIKNWVGLCIT